MVKSVSKVKWYQSLFFKSTIIFLSFVLVVISLLAVFTYKNQYNLIKNQKLENVRNIANYLEHLIQNSGSKFAHYQNYYMNHYSEIDIPYDFDEYFTAHKCFQKLIVNSNVNKYKDGKDLDINLFTEEEKNAYFTYYHEIWLLTFEGARKAFDIPYTYYLVPNEERETMLYMIDGERSAKDSEGNKVEKGDYLYLGDQYVDPFEEYPVQWNTWFEGKSQNDFQVWNNEWGYTYAYYVPVIIDGIKMGLIGAEVKVEEVNKEILKNTILISVGILLVLVICLALLLFILYIRYLKKIMILEDDIRE